MIRTRYRIPSYARGRVVGERLLALAVVIFGAVVGGKHIGPLRTRQGLAVRTVDSFIPDQRVARPVAHMNLETEQIDLN